MAQNSSGALSPRDETVRLIGNRFYEAHPFRAEAVGREELSLAKPLIDKLTDDELARFALPLMELLLERLEPCSSCHADLADLGRYLIKERQLLATQWESRVATRRPNGGDSTKSHCKADAGLLNMPEYFRAEPLEGMRVEYHAMAVDSLGWHVVAKVQRLSSPPLALGICDDPRAGALRRLADILCCGYWSNSNADFRRYKESRQEDAQTEWREYERVVRDESGALALESFSPQPMPPPAERPTRQVSYHSAEMNSRPYCVARMGAVLGAPAAVYMRPPEEKESRALDRLGDVFQLGMQGRCFADFAATLRETGHSDDAIRSEWDNCASAVVWEFAHRDTQN